MWHLLEAPLGPKIMLLQTRSLLVNGGTSTISFSKWHASSVLRLCSANRDRPNRPILTRFTHGGVMYEISDRGGPRMRIWQEIPPTLPKRPIVASMFVPTSHSRPILVAYFIHHISMSAPGECGAVGAVSIGTTQQRHANTVMLSPWPFFIANCVRPCLQQHHFWPQGSLKKMPHVSWTQNSRGNRFAGSQGRQCEVLTSNGAVGWYSSPEVVLINQLPH